MAITSRGYSGSVSFEEWAAFSADLGFRYGVLEATAFDASAGAGTRQVKVAKGTAWGVGVLDVSDASVTLTGASVAGQSRWDMIALRRDWDTKATSLVLVQGDSKAIPDRNTDPGTKDDQPLWLVRWAAGQSAPQEFVDLRVWNGDGGMIANDRMVRNYMNRLGTVLWIQGEFWVRTFNSTGNPAWMSAPVFSGTLTADQVRILTAGDVTASGGNPGLIIGPESGSNIGIDNNELQSRNNGQVAAFTINNDGGPVTIGSADSVINLRGDTRVQDPKIASNPASRRYVDGQVKAVADEVDTLTADMSRTNGVDHEPGWQVSNVYLLAHGPIAYFSATFTRTGPDIPVTVNGNVADQSIGKVTVTEYRPRNHECLASSGRLVTAQLNASGDILLTSTTPGSPITKGTSIGLTGTYLRQA